MRETKVDVIIPVYRPDDRFPVLLERLEGQTVPVQRVIVMNTEKEFWEEGWEERFPFLEVHHLKKKEFDHGGTRKRAAALSDAEFMVFMTQDALPENRRLLENLIRPFLKDEEVGAAYARQLPDKNCGFVERYTRNFNYPETSSVRTAVDFPVYGIKTFFCSNVCAAYRKKYYDALGGFIGKTIFNEDMIYAGMMVRHGWAVAYAADARVIHSHNYTCVQQFHRNFDLGVSQAEHPEIFAGLSSEGEGLRLVAKTLRYLLRNGKIWLIPGMMLQSACKYAGYAAGKHYKKLPRSLVLRCTMNRDYWEQEA